MEDKCNDYACMITLMTNGKDLILLKTVRIETFVNCNAVKYYCTLGT